MYAFFEGVPLAELIYLVFTRTPGWVTVSDSGLCCCVPCLSSAIISLCLLSHFISPKNLLKRLQFWTSNVPCKPEEEEKAEVWTSSYKRRGQKRVHFTPGTWRPKSKVTSSIQTGWKQVWSALTNTNTHACALAHARTHAHAHAHTHTHTHTHTHNLQLKYCFYHLSLPHHHPHTTKVPMCTETWHYICQSLTIFCERNAALRTRKRRGCIYRNNRCSVKCTWGLMTYTFCGEKCAVSRRCWWGF